MPLVFNDTYTGPRWTYGSQLRPFMSLFGYFDGWILFSEGEHPAFATFGTFQTYNPIPPETARRWNLVLIDPAPTERAEQP